MTKWRICAAWALLGLIFTLDATPSEAQEVDVALVLAVDVSASIKPDEARLQREGYAAAIEDPSVVDAIRHGMIGTIAVSYVEWAQNGHQIVILPWTTIDGPDEAASVAATLRSAEISTGTYTSIVHGLEFAASYLDSFEGQALRKVIDVSGDGRDMSGRSLAKTRDTIVARGITINGLPVEIDPDYEAIADYYRSEVIGGPGAFVIESKGRGDFAAAVRTKIALEIAGLATQPRIFASLP